MSTKQCHRVRCFRSVKTINPCPFKLLQGSLNVVCQRRVHKKTKPKKKRKRGKRAGRRKQRKINVVCNHPNGKKSIGNVPNCANLDNSVKIKINGNKKMTEPLKLAFMNAQSVCNDKTTLINDLVTDSKIDFLLITESWLKPVGSERDIKALTPPGFKLISFPRPTRGGGVCLIHRDSMTFKCVPLPRFKSFEGYEFRIQLPSHSIVFVGIYRPPPSTKNKLTMFMEEFPDLLDSYASKKQQVVFLGDVNFHYDSTTDNYVK